MVTLAADGISVVVLRRPGVHDIPAWALRSPVATILGIATNNDGYTKESITFPSSDAQTDLARKVLIESGCQSIRHIICRSPWVLELWQVMLRNWHQSILFMDLVMLGDHQANLF
eukprot:jgi/Botrbrau1/15494/Bobra.43_2s0111.1